MRIIDKYNDYYDYLSDSSDTLVFDRRDSIVWDKKEFKTYYFTNITSNSKYRFLLLQNGATFWLILATLNEDLSDYSLEVLDTWKDYNKPNALMKIQTIRFHQDYQIYDYRIHDYNYDLIKKSVPSFRKFITTNDFKVLIYIDKWNDWVTVNGKSGIVSRDYFPILKSTGIPTVIDPDTMFNAIEEYFSIEKTKSEKTVADGTTNNDKIKNHGFDTKTSFRGKA